MWPGFDSQTRRHMWVSLLVLYSALRSFPSGTPVFPSPQKPTFDLGRVRLTQFRNKNTWSDDLKRYVWLFEATQDNKDMFKIAF